MLDHPHWGVTETGGGYGIELSEIPLPDRRIVPYMDVALINQEKVVASGAAPLSRG